MGYQEKTVKKNIVFEGKIVNVRQDEAELHTGKRVLREVVEHSGGVAVLALDGEQNAIIVRQFRYPFMKELIEVPAGKLEQGEEHRSAALRELKEETGFRPEKFEFLGSIYPSPGYCAEILYLYLARELEQTGAEPDEDEYLNVEKIPFSSLVDMAAAGEIHDSKTLCAIFMAKERLEKESKGEMDE